MDANEWLRALRAAAAQGDLPAEAEACTQLSAVFGRLGDAAQAARYAQHALQICSALDVGSVDTAEAAERLAVVLCRAGCPAAAEKTLRDALKKATKAAGVVAWRVAPAQCVLHSALGRLKLHVREQLLTHECDYLSAEPILREVIFGQKGRVLLEEASGHFQKARACALAVQDAADARLMAAERAAETLAYMHAHCQLSDAMLLAARGSADDIDGKTDTSALDSARLVLEQLVHECEDIGLVFGPADLPPDHVLLSLAAKVCASAGRQEDAVSYLDQRLRLAEESGYDAQRAAAMLDLARCYVGSADYELAEETLYLAKALLDAADEDEALLQQTNALLKRVLGAAEALAQAERAHGAARGVLLCRAGRYADGLELIDSADASAGESGLSRKTRHVAAMAAARLGDWVACARHASRIASDGGEDTVVYVWAMERLGMLAGAMPLAEVLRAVDNPSLLVLAARVLLDRMGMNDGPSPDIENAAAELLSLPGSDALLADLLTRDYFADRKASRGAMKLVDGPFQLASRTLGKKRGLGAVRVPRDVPPEQGEVAPRRRAPRERASRAPIDLTALGDAEDSVDSGAIDVVSDVEVLPAGNLTALHGTLTSSSLSKLQPEKVASFTMTPSSQVGQSIALQSSQAVTGSRHANNASLPSVQQDSRNARAGGLAGAMFPTAPMRLFVDVGGASHVVTVLDARMSVAQLRDHVASCVSHPDDECPVLAVRPEISHLALCGARLAEADAVCHVLKDGSRVEAAVVRWVTVGELGDAVQALGLGESVCVQPDSVCADMLDAGEMQKLGVVLLKTRPPASVSVVSCAGVSLAMFSGLGIERLDASHSDVLQHGCDVCALPSLRSLSLAYCTGSNLLRNLKSLAQPSGEHGLEVLDLSGLGHVCDLPAVLSTTLPLCFPALRTLHLRHARLDAPAVGGLAALLALHGRLAELDLAACVWEADAGGLRPGPSLRRLVVSRATGLDASSLSSFGDRLVV